jgi:uncharacterized protein involved in exopolysaccharide biosynthesis
MNSYEYKSNSEVDLHELFSSIWANKIPLILTLLISISLGGFYSINAKKKYTSSALFSLQVNNAKSFLPAGLEAFSELSKPSSNTSDSVKDRIFGNVFIKKIDKLLDLRSDPFYNTYNKNSKSPVWKNRAKDILGIKNTPAHPEQIIWQNVVDKYKKTTQLDITKDGNILISLTHTNPNKIEKIVNTIMETIISDSKERTMEENNDQTIYLSQQLANALYKMNDTASKLNKFVIDETFQPDINFERNSLQFDGIKIRYEKNQALYKAVSALLIILTNSGQDAKDYTILRKKHPVIDQAEFRRIFGQNEIVNQWTWPSLNSTLAVFDTLKARKISLETQLLIAETETKKSSKRFKEFSSLKRETEFAEASYTVLLEQVKANSLNKGYTPSNSEIFEYASTPIQPSSPNRTLVLATSVLLGFFFGCILSVLIAKKRNRYHSLQLMERDSSAHYVGSLKKIQKLKRKNLNKLSLGKNKNSINCLSEIILDIKKSNKKIILTSNLNSVLNAKQFTNVISTYFGSEDIKILNINFSYIVKKHRSNFKTYKNSQFNIINTHKNLTELSPNNQDKLIDFLTKVSLNESLVKFQEDFDMIFLSSDNYDTNILIRALNPNEIFHVLLARKNYTKISSLKNIANIIPMEVLLYD